MKRQETIATKVMTEDPSIRRRVVARMMHGKPNVREVLYRKETVLYIGPVHSMGEEELWPHVQPGSYGPH